MSTRTPNKLTLNLTPPPRPPKPKYTEAKLNEGSAEKSVNKVLIATKAQIVPPPRPPKPPKASELTVRETTDKIIALIEEAQMPLLSEAKNIKNKKKGKLNWKIKLT